MSSSTTAQPTDPMAFVNLSVAPDEIEATASVNGCDINLHEQSIPYRGWLISAKTIDGNLWLRWQHPKECFPRYSCIVSDRGIKETILHAKFVIDLAIELEQETVKY